MSRTPTLPLVSPVMKQVPPVSAQSPVTEADILIESKSLSVFYGEHEAIKKVCIKMPRNQVVAMIGPSGCGKSTYLRSINRLNDLIPGCSVKGQLWIGDRDVYDPR